MQQPVSVDAQPTQASLVSTASFKLSHPRPLDLPPSPGISARSLQQGLPLVRPVPHLISQAHRDRGIRVKKPVRIPTIEAVKQSGNEATRHVSCVCLCCAVASVRLRFFRQNEPFRQMSPRGWLQKKETGELEKIHVWSRERQRRETSQVDLCWCFDFGHGQCGIDFASLSGQKKQKKQGRRKEAECYYC
ncbi:hypothetical protein HDV57DRAFT_494227 [Trichoderma longibrachiatum]